MLKKNTKNIKFVKKMQKSKKLLKMGSKRKCSRKIGSLNIFCTIEISFKSEQYIIIHFMIRIIKRVCITEKSADKRKNIKLSIIGATLSKRSDIFNWGQIIHNWDIIVRIKYKDYIYYLFQLVGVQKGHNQLSKLKHCQRHNRPRN